MNKKKALFTVNFLLFALQCAPTWMHGNFRLKLQNAPKLPDVHRCHEISENFSDPENSDPLKFIKKDLTWSQFLSPEMVTQCSQASAMPRRGDMLIFSSLAQLHKLTRFKIPDDICWWFFTEEIQRQSQYNIVHTEVSFLSTRCNSDNYLVPFWLYAYKCCMTITHFRWEELRPV